MHALVRVYLRPYRLSIQTLPWWWILGHPLKRSRLCLVDLRGRQRRPGIRRRHLQCHLLVANPCTIWLPWGGLGRRACLIFWYRGAPASWQEPRLGVYNHRLFIYTKDGECSMCSKHGRTTRTQKSVSNQSDHRHERKQRQLNYWGLRIKESVVTRLSMKHSRNIIWTNLSSVMLARFA